MQVVLELLAIENVLALEARDQARFFDILHLAAKLAVAENCVAFKLNLDHANAVAFVDHESDRQSKWRKLLRVFRSISGVRMTLGGQQLFQHADRVADFDRIVNAFFGNTDAPFAKRLEHI